MHKAPSAALLLLVLAASVVAEPPTDDEIVARTKAVAVSRLDSTLSSDESFENWLTRLFGREVAVSWGVNDCGEQTGMPADKERDLPFCGEAVLSLSGGATISIYVAMGTRQRGFSASPDVYAIWLERPGSGLVSVSKLSDLPDPIAKP